MTVRVGLNLLWLRPGEVGGTESYATRLIGALLEHQPDFRLYSVATRGAIDAHRSSIGATDVHRAPPGFESPVPRVLLERLWLRTRIDGFDVVHHLGGTVPFRSERPSVVTVHDLQPLDVPANFSPLKRCWLARSIPRAVERADVVTTPSDWVAEQIVDRYSIPADRVVTVSAFAGVDTPGRSESERDGVSDRVRSLLARGPVLLYPAMTMDHKNHHLLFDAFVRAAERRPNMQLVCTGPEGRDHAAIADHAARFDRVHMLGLVDANELAELMEGAEWLVFPSSYEGFGLPVLEAQQAGLPVIASDAGALPEVSGGAAVHVPPNDLDAWIDVLSSPPIGRERDELVRSGHQNAARYSPEAMAAAQVRAYRRALDNP